MTLYEELMGNMDALTSAWTGTKRDLRTQQRVIRRQIRSTPEFRKAQARCVSQGLEIDPRNNQCREGKLNQDGWQRGGGG